MARYSTLSNKDITSILDRYGIDFHSASPIAGGMTNSSYLVNHKYVLAVLDSHSLESANALVETMLHVRSSGVETPQPLMSQQGIYLQAFKNIPVVLVPFLETKTSSSPLLEKSERIGNLLARLHNISTLSSLPIRARRIPGNALETLENEQCDDLKEAVREMRKPKFENLLESFPQSFCHGDLMNDNILELPNDDLVPIDWETATIDSTILDVGIAAVSAVMQNIPVADFITPLLQGYSQLQQCSATRSVTATAEEVGLATAYACTLMSYHRYLRQNVNYPNPKYSKIYKELLPFVMGTIE